MELRDRFDRKINYLRLSVTDLCNLRCRYCMPEAGVAKLGHEAILSYEDMLRVARAAVSLGVEKIRITGGEPLVRRGLVPFLGKLAALPGLKELVLTTNGVLLPSMAADLKSAGVQRVNISLDSLRPERFRAITRCGELGDVLAGIDAAESIGFPVKLNVVVMRGLNDDELEDFAALTLHKNFSVRFIEYMPNIKDAHWQDQVVSGEEILQRIGQRYAYRSLEKAERCGPSRDFRIEGAAGSLGVITPVFSHFCKDCNRIRVTSTGQVRSCLFSDAQVDLKPVLHQNDERVLLQALQEIVMEKAEGHCIGGEEDANPTFAMSSIGG